MAWAMSGHSHVCLPTSRNPSPRSASIEARLPVRSCGTRSREKQAPAARKVAASTPMAQPDPTAATSTPPTTYPSVIAVVVAKVRTATARASASRGTVCCRIALPLGPLSAERTPTTPPRTAMPGMLTTSSTSPAASPASTAAQANAEPSSSSRRGTRSPSMPPTSVVVTSSSAKTAMTMPSSLTDPPRSRTAKASATGVIALPSALTAAPLTRRRNSWWRSGFTCRIQPVDDTGDRTGAAGGVGRGFFPLTQRCLSLVTG